MNIKQLTLIIGLTSLVPVANAGTVFSDSFDYTGWDTGATPANSTWTNSTATGSTATILNPNNANFAGGWRFNGSNGGVIHAGFSNAATTDFSLTIDIMPQAYSRFIWVGAFNADGTHGYGFTWDTGTTDMYGGEGAVGIKEFTATNPDSEYVYNTSGTLLGSLARSGKVVSSITSPLSFQLTWDGNTNTLALSSYNSVSSSFLELKSYTFTDTSNIIDSFSRIYIGGNSTTTGTLFDSVLVNANIPEPSSTGLLAAGAIAMFAFSRRSPRALHTV